MACSIYQIDAFTNEIFGGNPAAVVPLDKWLPDQTLLNISAENNLSETAFYVQTDSGFHIRWFTPTTEVDLCGHATLAASWVIFNKTDYDKDSIEFKSLSGKLLVQNSADGLTLDFPTWESSPSETIDPIFEQAFGKAPLEVHKGKKWIGVYEDADFIKTVTPDIDIIKTIDSQGVVITAAANERDLDFISRYFGPQLGIDEDPVTGSAHCILAPIWAQKLNKTEFKAHQASQRGGDLTLSLQNNRVLITGNATLYMEGTLYV